MPEPPAVGGRALLRRPYSRPTARTVHGSHLHHGEAETYELRTYVAGGDLERILRAGHRDLTLGAEDREAYRRAIREHTGAEGDELLALDRALAEIAFPPTLPAHSHLVHVDAEDHLWVGHYHLPGGEGPLRWDVFDPDGRLLGTVETPRRLEIHQIGPDFVVGTWTGELDVQSVRVYGLNRG